MSPRPDDAAGVREDDHYDDDYQPDDDGDDDEGFDDCGWNGRDHCSMIGSEYCDWSCRHRDDYDRACQRIGERRSRVRRYPRPAPAASAQGGGDGA